MIKKFIQPSNDSTKSNEFWAGANNGHYFHNKSPII